MALWPPSPCCLFSPIVSVRSCRCQLVWSRLSWRRSCQNRLQQRSLNASFPGQVRDRPVVSFLDPAVTGKSARDVSFPAACVMRHPKDCLLLLVNPIRRRLLQTLWKVLRLILLVVRVTHCHQVDFVLCRAAAAAAVTEGSSRRRRVLLNLRMAPRRSQQDLQRRPQPDQLSSLLQWCRSQQPGFCSLLV